MSRNFFSVGKIELFLLNDLMTQFREQLFFEELAKDSHGRLLEPALRVTPPVDLLLEKLALK